MGHTNIGIRKVYPTMDTGKIHLISNVGSDLVTNGGFDSVTTGWIPGNDAVLSSVAGGQSGNCLKVARNVTATPFAYQGVTTVVGKLYRWSVYFKKGDGSIGAINIGTSPTGSEYFGSGALADVAWTKYTGVFKATATTVYIAFMNYDDDTKCELFDTMTLFEVNSLIPVSHSSVVIDTEAAGATDDLDTIYGGQPGQIIVLSSIADARDVVVKDGAGLLLQADFTLGTINDSITLECVSLNAWKELSRAANG